MFVPLRLHSVFSKGKGGLTLGEAAAWAGRMKLPAAALTDIDNIHGWAKWKRAADSKGFVPLFGCETELGGRRFLLLVKERQGYEHLVLALNRKELTDTGGLVVILIPGPADGPFLEQADALRRSEDFYLGCDFFNFKTVLGLAERHGLRPVWANPLKFVRSPERVILLRAIQNKIPFPPERDRLLGRMGLFGPDQEAPAVRKLGPSGRAALDRTLEVAGKCRFDFQGIVPQLPSDLFATPLREVVMERLRDAGGLSWDERQRALRELEAIEGSGFGPYFLIVYDVVEFARKRGILHNLKGSGASSFVAFLLGISHINPVEFDLYFERFLNPGRNDPPDIDLDFDSRRRDEVLAYVLQKYGGGRTGAAFVCSLKNYRARSALYETARAMGVPPEEARSLSKKVPFFAEPDSLKKDRPPAGFREVWRLASDLTGVYCEKSLHVGGVILTPAPADCYLPLESSAKGLVMSHFDRDAVEDLKLIKLDLLSVRGLAAVSRTKDGLNLRTIPAGDARAFALLKKAATIGCFQVESPAMMNLLRRMKPDDIRELTQALALIRPGPTESGMKETLLRGREGRSAARDPFLERILPETGGLLLYEEQVMQAAERAAGMPAGEGDLLRRSLRRRGGDGLLREKFFSQARARGYAAAEVERLWRAMERFSSYSFNKAHSASYAAMAYQAVYLKAHHPVPYLAAVLNAGGGYYEFTEYIEEAKRLGIRLLGPDANRSSYEFEVEDGAIRVGLTSIKNLALKTADKIVEERKNGAFASIEDFLSRVHLTRTELLALIRAGVFDSLESSRTRQILRYFQGLDGWDVLERAADLAPQDKARMTFEALGFLPEGDALSLFEGERPALRIKDLASRPGEDVELLVRVVDARRKETSGGPKYFYLFEDETGQLEGVGEKKGPAFGAPPVCFLRAEVRCDRAGRRPKAIGCSLSSASPRPQD